MAVSPLPCLSGSKGAAQNELAPAGDDTRVRPCNDAAEAAGTAAAADEAAHLLVEACKRGDVAALALRLQAADVNRFVRGGSAARPFAASPLWWACGAASAECIHALLDAGADIEAVDSLEDTTPLHRASFSGNVAAVAALLSSGAAPSATARRGYTALHYAASASRHDVIALLVAAGASPGETALGGRTAFSFTDDARTVASLLLPRLGAAAAAAAAVARRALAAGRTRRAGRGGRRRGGGRSVSPSREAADAAGGNSASPPPARPPSRSPSAGRRRQMPRPPSRLGLGHSSHDNSPSHASAATAEGGHTPCPSCGATRGHDSASISSASALETDGEGATALWCGVWRLRLLAPPRPARCSGCVCGITRLPFSAAPDTSHASPTKKLPLFASASRHQPTSPLRRAAPVALLALSVGAAPAVFAVRVARAPPGFAAPLGLLFCSAFFSHALDARPDERAWIAGVGAACSALACALLWVFAASAHSDGLFNVRVIDPSGAAVLSFGISTAACVAALRTRRAASTQPLQAIVWAAAVWRRATRCSSDAASPLLSTAPSDTDLTVVVAL